LIRRKEISMFLEILCNDISGEILSVYYSEVYPNNLSRLFFRHGKNPANSEQCRISLDTELALEIKSNIGDQAVISDDGKAIIKRVIPYEYLRDSYIVDTSKEVKIPEGVVFPEGMKLRKLKRK
tara:strand:+ start:83 stop:454 length:372 start_codon:yes stop_codon:yes gene_type:complete